MSVPLLLGVVYLISELLLTVTRRSRSRTGTKQDRSTLLVVWLVIMVSVAAEFMWRNIGRRRHCRIIEALCLLA